MVQFAFDARTVPFAEASLPVWEGPVPVQILRTEVKPTAANNGSNMLVLHVGALAGEYRGQENAIRLNIWNANAQAVDIAQKQLSSIAHCTQRLNFTDTDQLIGGQFLSVWAKESRDVVDQQKGETRRVDGCQCKDFKLIDGRTIREAMAGQPASQPYDPNARNAAPAAPAPQTQYAPQPQAGAQPSMQGQFGGQPQGGPAAPQPGFQPPQGQGPSPGFAPSTGTFAPPSGAGMAGGPAMAPNGGQPGLAPAPGMQTAQSGFNPAPQQPYAPQPGQQPGQQPQQGFAPPQQQQGFAPPGAPQPGAGPWGPQQR